MIRFVKIALLVFTSLTCITCSDNDDEVELSDGNYLIFGHFYGHCFGDECIETFKLTSSDLFEDSLDDYAHESYSFNKLGVEKFNKSKHLLSFIPPELLVEKKDFIGCPDCADQGGIYIEYKNGDSIQAWKIDQNKSQIPNYLHAFIDEVNKTISIINN